MRLLLACALVLAAHVPAQARQALTGYVSATADLFPDVPIAGTASTRAPARQDAVPELRLRLFADARRDVGPLRLHAAGQVDALAADRGHGAAGAAIVRPRELYAELHGDKADLRLGYTRVVWGRLDELQPTDVVNPIDVSRFFFEGRSDARLPVPMVRGTLYAGEDTVVEGLLVAAFRRSRFDELDEETSPFNLAALPLVCPPGGEGTCLPPAHLRDEPGVSWRTLQGGGRVQTTIGRVDLAVSAFRGFEQVGLLTLAEPLTVVERFPRFTMLGADFETVRGVWGLRGEMAVFAADTFQAPDLGNPIEGRSVEGGLGVDRRAGDFRISGNVLVRRRMPDDEVLPAGLDRTDVNLVAAVDRGFARETRRLRVFGVADPTEGTAFLRAIFSMSLRDGLSCELSGGLFTGSGPDTLGLLTKRDFVSVRLIRHF